MTIDYTNISEYNSFPVEKELNESAYFKWLEAGCPEGRDIEFWCAAEREMFGYTGGEMDEYRYDESELYYEQEVDP